MARPSISGMFDSRIRIWRPTVDTSDATAVEQRTYTPLATVDAAINRSRTPQVQQSGGMQDSGIIRWYGLSTIDVQVRDVCEVVSGPDSGRTWEVNEEPVHPRAHHTQVDCVEWHGVLPTEDIS